MKIKRSHPVQDNWIPTDKLIKHVSLPFGFANMVFLVFSFVFLICILSEYRFSWWTWIQLIPHFQLLTLQLWSVIHGGQLTLYNPGYTAFLFPLKRSPLIGQPLNGCTNSLWHVKSQAKTATSKRIWRKSSYPKWVSFNEVDQGL